VGAVGAIHRPHARFGFAAGRAFPLGDGPPGDRAPRCESEAYVWAVDRPDGTLDFHFAVENPQGLSAKAWATILAETLNGQPLEQVARVSGDQIFEIFGRDLSMGKGQGLISILDLLQHEVKQRLIARRG